jgi:trimeric autotransporter adhesin
MARGAIVLGALLGSVLFFSGCGSVSVSGCLPAPCMQPPSQPAIVAISPTNIPAGSAGFTLTITGTGLGITSQVNFGGAVLSPASATPANCPSGGNCTMLTVPVPAQDVASPNTITVSVANSSLVSNPVAFAVTPHSSNVTGAPQLLVFSPLAAPTGSASFHMVIEAQNVAQGATVNFGSLSLSPITTSLTFYPSAGALSSLIVQVPATALTAAGEVAVSVTNPGASGGTSNQGNFFVLSKSTFPIEESVSNATPPVPGNAPSTHSSVAIDGFFVAFDSTASNLVSGTASGHSQIYLRQNCFAAAPNCTPQTTLLSAAPDGSPGSGGLHGSDKPVITPDGRFVVFESDDTNLAPGATQPIEQIYLRDTCHRVIGPVVPGCTPQTTLVSASPSGTPGNAASTNPAIGALGLLITFQSSASNLVSQSVPSGVQQVYLRIGCIAMFGPPVACQPPAVVLESVDAAGNPGDKDSTNPSLDATGLVVGFQSLADNIVANTAGNGFQQIYMHSTCLALASPITGGLCRNTAQAVSVDSGGHLGTADSVTPAVGPFGNFGVFATRAPNLLPANTANQQIVSFNACFDVPPIPCSSAKGGVVSVDQNGMPGQGDSSNPSFAGARVAFTSQASLLSGVTGQQVYSTLLCLFPSAIPCGTGPVLVSADSSGKPIGGDHAAIDLTNTFVNFSSAGSASASGPTQIFLAAPFF